MALFIGSDAAETIDTDFVSATVTSDPPGARPSAVDDVIYGGGGNDRIEAGGGGDLVNGGLGDDQVRLGAGNDVFVARHDEAANVEEGHDIVNGGSGYDRYQWSGMLFALEVSIEYTAEGLLFAGYYSSGPQERWALLNEIEVLELSGGMHNFKFRDIVGYSLRRIELELGEPGSITDHVSFEAGDGNRTIVLREEGTTVTIGGLGVAASIANMSADGLTILTGLGDDTVDGSMLDDGVARLRLYGGEGSDTLSYARSAAGVTGDLAAAHTANGFEGYILDDFENLTGSRFGDTLLGDAGANRIDGGGGNDILDGRGGADTMRGGAGNDRYSVDDASDVVVEAEGSGFDEVHSAITYVLGANLERLYLGDGNLGGFGNALENVIGGGDGDNVLRGNGSNDTLRGGLGGDRLLGGAGLDVLNGGAGMDSFHFDTAPAAANADRIEDFVRVDDTIVLQRGQFGDIPIGALAPDAFVRGTAAQDAEDRIVYDAPTGRLFFDPDGAGGATAILFARVDPGTELANTDFRGI